ncbi:hypothetical protein Tco_0151795 [Tanacetum coccineum]
MANQEQNHPQQEQPFVAANQVGFNLKDIISTQSMRKPFTRSSNMYKEYLAEFWYSAKALKNSKVYFSIPTGGIFGEVGVNSFRNAIGAHYLPHFSEYVAPPFIDVVRQWFPMIGYGEEGVKLEDLIKSQTEEETKGKGCSLHSISLPTDNAQDKEGYGDDESKSASGCDALVDSTAEANLGLSAPNDSIPQQQNMDEGTKNTSYDHIFAGTDPHVLADQTKSVSEGLENVLTQPIIGKGASFIARQVEEEEASNTIKLEDLAKLVSNVEPSFKDLDSPEDDHVIVVDDSDEDEEDEVHPTLNAETKDTSVPKSSSPRSSQIQELTNQVLILQSQKHKLGLEKNKAEAEAALLKA